VTDFSKNNNETDDVSFVIEPLENMPYFYFRSSRHNGLESMLHYVLLTVDIPTRFEVDMTPPVSEL